MKVIFAFLLLTLPLMCSKSGSEDNFSYADEIESSRLEVPSMQLTRAKEDTYDQVQEQKLIKESYLRFETQDLEKTYKEITKHVLQNNGYIQDDEASKSYNQFTRRLIIRIPTDTFQKTIDSIASHVEYFDTKQITSKDVTEEFIDLEARLKAKETLEARYLELLKKANNVKEVLEIERELSTIREEIEAKQGRLKYLQNKVSLSTLTVEFYKTTSESGVTVSYGQKMWNAIASGFDGLSFFFLGILYMWPFIILLLLLVFGIKRWLKRKKQ
ncbi:MAG: DUF4349 domain-containing protein [Gelidibacter sp.]